MELVKVPAIRRNESGKGPARRLRNEGRIPATAYGKEMQAESLAVLPKDLFTVLKSAHGRNSVIELEVEGEGKRTVLLADYQYHPISREFLHADFLQIHLDRPVNVDVPFELTGKAKGVVAGGVLHQVYRKLPIRCLPEKIPVKIEYDVTELELDDHVAVRELALPEGVEVRLDESRTVAGVVTETKRLEEEEEAEAAAAAAAAVGAEGAPAAPPAAPGTETPEPKT